MIHLFEPWRALSRLSMTGFRLVCLCPGGGASRDMMVKSAEVKGSTH